MAQMEYTAQNLEYAVSVFYNGEQSERGRAHAWLTTSQRVPEAWNFVWELLQPTKLAAFILQQGTVDLATILRPLSTLENTNLLLEVLTVIPEEMEYTAQNLEYAVSVFYNGEQSERGRAHAWLTTSQRVPEAWNFVWELLQPTKATEVQFYAATTLHTKILRCWNEVPPESYDELKEKLLQAIFTYSKGPKIVTNRLCISLAAFILQQGTVDLATILRPLSTLENTNLLLEVLTVIPEEYNSMTMGSYLRNKNRAALQQACPAVLDDMLRYLQSVYNDYSKESPSEQIVQSWVSAATCATSWLTLGGEEASDQYNADLPDRMPLCRALLTVVQVLYTWNEAVSDTALDACEACLSGVRAAGGGHATPRHPVAALQLLADVATLAAPIMHRDNVPNSINEELVCALVTCCVALCETHSRALVRAVEGGEVGGGGGARQLLELLLAAQAAPGHYPLHETRSNLVFGFWYTLQDEVLNVPEEGREVCAVWREVFSRLLAALVAKCEAPPDAALSRDDLELLRCYRQDIADAVIYCYGVLGEWSWALVERELTSASSEARREAALHVFLALNDVAPHERECEPLLNMLQHAVDITNTSTNKRMLNTALDCLGGYAAWLSSVSSERARALGAQCVRAAGGALARCAPPAALALRKLCADCRAPAAALAPDIVRAAMSSSEHADAWVRRQLVGAAGSALAAAEPDVAAPLLRALALSLRDELAEQALSAESGQSSKAGAAESCAALVGALCPQPALAAQLFPALAPALAPFALHPDLVEPLFLVLKQVLTTLDDCLPLMPAIGELTVTGFNCHPCAIGLEVFKLLVLVVGGEWAGSRAALGAGLRRSLAALAPAPAARPDLVEALFSLLAVITKKKPLLLPWLDDLMPDLVELSCASLLVWEGGAARAACVWLAALAARRPHHLQQAAPHITSVALRCIGGLTPRSYMEPLAELLLALGRAAWGAGCGAGGDLAAWLRRALAEPGFPTAHATDTHKDKFIAAVIKEKSSKRRLLETVQEFSLVCRGLVGTEYARQTIASKQLVA